MSNRTFAQNFQVGAMGGASLLDGDYPSYRFDDTFSILANAGFGVFLRRPITDRFGIKGSLFFTSFSGNDELDPVNLGFRTPSSFKYPVIELQLTLDFSIFSIRIASKPIDLYLIGGIGFTKTTIHSVFTEGSCPVVNLSIPVGGGIRMPINENIGIFLQGEMVQGLNDCLEGYAGPTGAKDLYGSMKLGVSYSITPSYSGSGKSIGCPRF